MRVRKCVLIPIAIAAVLLPVEVEAQSSDEVEATLGKIEAVAQRRVDAAQADLDLVQRAWLGMHSALRAGGPSVNQAVDASLQPLRIKWPDGRLRYAGEGDRCDVLDAVLAIRFDALRRMERALDVVADAKMRLTIYYAIKMEMSLAALNGKAVSESTIRDAFMRTIDADDELAVFDQSNKLDPPLGTSGCNGP